jgi:ATP-dependent Clp protease protease subunit
MTKPHNSSSSVPNLKETFEDRNGLTIPTIYEDDETGRRMGYDIFSRLAKDGIVTLNGAVTEQSAAVIVAQLLWLNENFKPKNEDHMITLYINSPGGSVTAGMAIYDTMMKMKFPIRTVATGLAASMGSFLLMAGAPGERFADPNAEIMIHEVSAGTSGKASAMDDMSGLFQRTNDRLIKFYEFHTGLDEASLRTLMQRKDTFMNAEEAAALGLVDHIGYESYDETNEWKKKWADFVEKLNREEAVERGKPRQPVNDDNLMAIAKNRRAPK